MSECKHDFERKGDLGGCLFICPLCKARECDVLREENDRLKMKLLEKDDHLIGTIARLEHENKRLQAEGKCNNPDHDAINAERAECRGLRKSWIKADNENQKLRKWREAGRATLKTFPGELRGCTAFDALRECEREEKE